jgi:nicotinamidase-related amidase
MQNKALLVIDVQNDYFPGGQMELVNMAEATRNIKKLISFFRETRHPVIFIQHLAVKLDASFFLPETKGAEIHESIKPLQTEPVIVKNFPNSFKNTSLQNYLQEIQITKLVICGAMSHMCIDTTTRVAADMDYSCTLVDDACATRDLSFNNQIIKASDVHLAYMAALNGTFARVCNTDQFINSNGIG